MLGSIIYKIAQCVNKPKLAGIAQEKSIDFFKNVLQNTGFQNITYISGGYVRDYVMNVESNDLDLVVESDGGAKQLSQFMLNLFDGYIAYEKLNPFYPTYNLLFKDNIIYAGKKYLLNGADIDISDTAQKRYAEDSGKKQLFVYGTLQQDALQRDFTINALYLDLNYNIIDPTNLGITDIRNNLLRLIPNGNYEEKLWNNPKVLLRYCRFYSKYKTNIIKSDIEIMKKFANRITTLEEQQIKKQIDKILPQDLNYAIKMMKIIGIYPFLQETLIKV